VRFHRAASDKMIKGRTCWGCLRNHKTSRLDDSALKELIEQLVSVVAEEAEHCERILTLLRHQQRHLVEGNVEELRANVLEQENAMRRSRELEQRRQTLLDNLAQTPAFDGERPGLARLITTLSDDYGRRLETLRTSMTHSIQQVIKTKEQNQMLIERSLFNINETIQLLASANASAADYAMGGAERACVAAPLSVDRLG